MTDERLKLFGVSPEEDVIATTTDGANICKKYGRELKVVHQLCHDHGIHLAIRRVIYKKVDEDVVKKRKARRFPQRNEYENDDSEYESDEEPVEDDDNFNLKPDIGDKINKVRAIVKLFKKSPKLNDMLQDYIVEERGKKLQLQLDVRTRWHSMLVMLETFVKVSGPVKKALGEINSLEMWDSDMVPVIKGIFEPLNLTKMAMDQISRDDANLLTAEGTFEWLFDELKEINSTVSLELIEELKVEFDARRLKDIASLLKFLQNPKSFEESNSSYFGMPSKTEVFAFATSFWNKYFKEKAIDLDNDQHNEELSQLSVSTEELNAASRLGLAIVKRTAVTEVPKTSSDDKGIKLACQNFISTNVMHPCLKEIFDSLLLIKPTSIKNEQNFSMSSNFLSNKRKQMLCGTLDDLCLLKSHYCALYKN